MVDKTEIEAELAKHTEEQRQEILEYCQGLTRYHGTCKVGRMAGYLVRRFDIPLKRAGLLAQAFHRYLL